MVFVVWTVTGARWFTDFSRPPGCFISLHPGTRGYRVCKGYQGAPNCPKPAPCGERMPRNQHCFVSVAAPLKLQPGARCMLFRFRPEHPPPSLSPLSPDSSGSRSLQGRSAENQCRLSRRAASPAPAPARRPLDSKLTSQDLLQSAAPGL